MTKPMKTPGVYINELYARPNTVVPVPTSIPAFIGYTFLGEDLCNKPRRVTSLYEFYRIFGKEPPLIQFDLEKTESSEADFIGQNGENYLLKANGPHYRMYKAVKFFYQNGGDQCYIVSVGNYTVAPNLADLIAGIDLLEKVPEPTLLLVPDAVELFDESQIHLKDKFKAAYALQSHMVNHCGSMGNRMSILDIPLAYWQTEKNPSESIDAFRENVNPIRPNYNAYAAAYYPWLHTFLYPKEDYSYKNLSANALKTLDYLLQLEAPKKPEVNRGPFLLMVSQLTGQTAGEGADDPPMTDSKISKEEQLKIDKKNRQKADQNLQLISKAYQSLREAILKKLNLTPPSGAIAGIYTTVDNTAGVWKAPANISMIDVKAPAINISQDFQEDLNAPLSGKAINPIRLFPNNGLLIWGARTLDGNSTDWRYINIKRAAIFLEQSIKQAIKDYEYEPNTANTWVSIKSMIQNFLTNLWKQGGLVGSSPSDAYTVNVGLGSTMTAEDILNGILRVSVKVALSHPAEFIEISFQQKMQES
ncbi:phage tail sheath family protein [Cyclobacterium qasimii]|uniref:Tail sheath protein C-terminal domain-containing protein n=1 Tax=Cyclobacterium qasimii TaxID=1350429 RepID=A0A512C6L8_9BACT|nr:phage tail sheath C-terminal domain-containing protein [Cyclobacterium qasimii]GEO19853.1 hypothetical protein CQA01_03870 [Cyclobacterium qasimii]